MSTRILIDEPATANWISDLQRAKGRPIPTPVPPTAERASATVVELGYSPGQKRDSVGRFGSGGGTAGGSGATAREFDSVPQGHAWGEEHFDTASWGNAQFDAARKYVGGTNTGGADKYDTINGWARGQRPPYIKPKAIEALDRLTAREIPETIVARRAVGTGSFEHLGGIANVQPGTVMQDGGFLSTNLGPAGAIGMNRKTVAIRITVPQGSHGAYIGFKGISGRYHSKEAELLLPRDTKLRIDGVRQNGNRWDVDATVVTDD